ncbi:MAG: glycosyltransferase [Anaerolineae bacterium]|nr:glycosyltransferase [Anaerolineae bacterium]MCX8067349.1 glycosyltransferase [Anaerolineae bacterium]
MFLAFLNPQGNFDPQDRYWTQHPDFGGQLVYVKQVALALGRMGHRVDILTRRIRDPQWPGLDAPLDGYPGAPNVRIIRIPAGPDTFLPKEELWPYIGPDWVAGILDFYRQEGCFPDVFTAHYGDGGLAGVLLTEATGIPFTFTAHSLGAQKMDGLGATPENLAALDARYHFARRLAAERLSMNRSAVNIVSTCQERFQQYGHRAYQGAVDVGDDRRFAVVPPGVDTAVFDPGARTPEEEVVRRRVLAALERDIREDRRHLPCIVASSRLEPKKNHLGLVVAFAQNPALRKRANLLLVTPHLEDPLRREEGSPTEQEILARIREVVRDHNLWGEIATVALAGHPALAAAYRLLARCRSVFALTAWHEPFGLAPLEAAATGLPVVVTRNGGPAEIWREDGEEYGVLVDPADPTDIARGLLRLLESPQTWEEFARRGRERVLARYTWERTAEGYLNVAQQVREGDLLRPSGTLLPIPPYFRDPRPENDIPLEVLRGWYFGE